MSSKPQLHALTGLRFWLALWVVVFHQSETLGRVPPSVSGILGTGYVAVGFFFVLSGFVLAYNYSLADAWPKRELVRFGMARFARIYPAYVLGLAVVAPAILFGAHGRLRPFSAMAACKESLLGVLNLALLQSWIPQTALSWNGPGWSLSNEAFFYLCFPFIGWRLWRLSGAASIGIGALCIWAAALAAPAIAMALPIAGFGNAPATYPVGGSFWPNLVKFHPLLRLPDFCMGILLARAFQLCRESRLQGCGQYLYVPALAVLAIVPSQAGGIPYPAVHNSLLLPVYAGIILGLALGGGFLARLLASRPLVFLGGASYAMYILHAPLASWFFGAARRIYGHDVTGPVPVAGYALAVVTGACLVFAYFEQPLNRYLRHRLSRFDQPDTVEHHDLECVTS